MKAREIVGQNGGQKLTAERLGVQQPAVSKALKADDTSMDKLRARILEELGGIRVYDEPHYEVEELPKKKGGKK